MGEGVCPGGISLLAFEESEELVKNLFIALIKLLGYPLNAEGLLVFFPNFIGVKDAMGTNPIEDFQLSAVGRFGV